MTVSEATSSPSTPVVPRLVWSNLAAQVSEQIALAAAPLAAVLLLGAGPAETSLLHTVQTLPFLILALPLGLVADRSSRLRLIMGAEALRALSLVALLALLFAGGLTLPALAGLGFIGALGTVAYSVAAPALVSTLLPAADWSRANRGLELARSIAYAAGPALGGVLVSITGVPAAYAVAAVLSVAAALLLAGLVEPARPAPEPRHPLTELADGARFVLKHPLLRPILLTAVVYNASWFVLQGVFVAYAIQVLDLTPAAVGITLGIYGVGMVAGALAAGPIARHLPPGRVIALGPAAAFLAAVLVGATLVIPSALLTAAAFFLFGAGPILWTIMTTTLRQSVTPNAMLGRVSALVVTATFGARPIGAALAAIVALQWGVEACLGVVVAGFALQFLIFATSPVSGLTVMPSQDPSLVRT